jgi:hypothetical protein
MPKNHMLIQVVGVAVSSTALFAQDEAGGRRSRISREQQTESGETVPCAVPRSTYSLVK